MSDLAAFTQLMQFLMGLNNVFDSVRHQLLVMHPIPSIYKAYAMVQSVEKQKQVHYGLIENTETTTLHVKGGMRNEKKKFNVDKRAQHCTHCDKIRHSKDTCFKLHGTPNWYKELVDKKRRDARPTRGFTVETTTKKGAEIQPDTKEELLHELIKLMKHSVQPDQFQGNFAQIDDFADSDPLSSSSPDLISSLPFHPLDLNLLCHLLLFLLSLLILFAGHIVSILSLSGLQDYEFYMDDILLTGSSDATLHAVKEYLDRLFTIKDLGPA
ncbi:UNVERIFIED_CONTAM: hypothetical protein Sangu_2604100 [Sesamum angustifolium]|uniref:Uncharacterized protein n=1 Tax=Sesamum angustifolium TaxID=2727405 RepID=A0AAW2J632_9LAMI